MGMNRSYQLMHDIVEQASAGKYHIDRLLQEVAFMVSK